MPATMINFQLKFKDYYRKKGKKRPAIEVYEEWLEIKEDYLNNMSPRDYFQSVKDIETLVDMLKLYEDDIPAILIKSIKNYGTEAIKPLFRLAGDKNLIKKDFYRHGPINAIYILGELRNIKTLPYLIKIINICEETNEVFEYTADGIIKLGKEAITPLIKAIQTTKNEITRCHLSWILSRLGPDEKIFEILITLCQEAPAWKGFYAEVLCDYGDKRAVPLLQRIVCEEDFSYEELDQVERALVMLGGEWNWDYEEKGVPLTGKAEEIKEKEVEKKQEEKLDKKLETLQQRKLTEIKQEAPPAEKTEKKEKKSSGSTKKKGRRKKSKKSKK